MGTQTSGGSHERGQPRVKRKADRPGAERGVRVLLPIQAAVTAAEKTITLIQIAYRIECDVILKI